MTKIRLESFSDGIFAIAATLLVLNISLPAVPSSSDKELGHLLYRSLANIITFVFTFLVVGTFWIAHNRIFSIVKRVDHFILWSNIFYLLTIALIPFPTFVLATHPFNRTAILFYSFVLFICGIQQIIIIVYLHKHTDQVEENFSHATFNNSIKIATVGPLCYLLAMVTSLFYPTFSFCFIIAVLVFYIFIAPRLVRHIPLIFNYH